jgi:hypothetical protein
MSAQKKKPQATAASSASKNAKWKNKSEMFRQAMRAARGPDERGGNNSNFVPSGPTPEDLDDRTEC